MNSDLIEELISFFLDTVEQYESGDAAATHRVRQQQYKRAHTLLETLNNMLVTREQ